MPRRPLPSSAARLSLHRGLSIAGALAAGVLMASPAQAGLIPPPGAWPAPVGAPNPQAGLGPVGNGVHASGFAHLHVWIGRRHRAAITQTAGRSAVIRGSLDNDLSDQPITGAIVNIVTQNVYGGDWVAAVDATTNSRGAFRAVLPPGGHRRVAFVYWPSGDAQVPLYSRRLLIRVRSRVWLGQPRHKGAAYRFRGRVSGGEIPATGLLIALQVRNSQGNWITIRLARTGATGRFAVRRRLPPGRFPVRVVAPSQASWALYAGTSQTRRVGR